MQGQNKLTSEIQKYINNFQNNKYLGINFILIIRTSKKKYRKYCSYQTQINGGLCPALWGTTRFEKLI